MDAEVPPGCTGTTTEPLRSKLLPQGQSLCRNGSELGERVLASTGHERIVRHPIDRRVLGLHWRLMSVNDKAPRYGDGTPDLGARILTTRAA